MYRNLAWKLIPTVLFLALCVVTAVSGRPSPDAEGFFGLKLQLGQDLKGGTSLVYRMVHIETAELEKQIATLRSQIATARSKGEPVDEKVSELEKLQSKRDALFNDYREKLRDFNTKTRDVLARRLNATGLAGIEVRPYGEDRLMITLPTHVDLDRQIQQIIESSGKLYFRMEANRDDEKFDGLEYPDNPNRERYRWVPIKQGQMAGSGWADAEGKSWMLIDFEPQQEYTVFEGEDLANVFPTQDERGKLAVGFEFKTEDHIAAKFGDFTAKFQEDAFKGGTVPRLCIIFNEEVYWAGTIKDRINGRGHMTGFDTIEEQRNMINLIRSGSLPVRLALEGKNQTGAGLGEDSIRTGLLSMAIGGAVVLLFIIVYYLAGGLISAIALVMNLCITLAIMVWLGAFQFPATLTMPGIAGLILSIGMAIDANILIYERIREEKERIGASLRDAVEKGFDRSAVTILDANITTIITGVILYIVGTPEIRGFAITLIIGIFASLFTALVFSRFVIGALVVSGSIKRFAMLTFFRDSRIPFMKYRKWCFLGSTVLIAVGLSFFASRGTKNLGIDFLGGHLYTAQLTDKVDVEYVRNALESLKIDEGENVGKPKYPDVQVTPSYHAGELGGGTVSDQFELRFPMSPDQQEADQTKIQREIRLDLEKVFSGSFKVEGIEAPLPGLVEPGYVTNLRNVEKVAYTIHIPFETPPVKETVVEEAFQGPIIGELQYLEISAKGSLNDLQAQADATAGQDAANQAPAPKWDWNVDENGAVITISNIAVDPSTFGTADYQFAKAATDALQNLLRPLSAEDAQTHQAIAEYQEYLKGKGLNVVRHEGKASVDVQTIPERAEVIIEFHLSEPLPLAQFEAKPETISADDPTKYNLRGELQTKLQQDLRLVSGFGEVTIPGGTNPQNPDVYGLVLETTEGDAQPMVKHLRVFTGVADFASALDADNEKFAPTLIQRIARQTRTFLQEQAQRTISEPFPREQVIGASIAAGLQEQAMYAVIASLICIIIYIWLRFASFGYGLGATLALAHDIMFALGAIAFIDHFTNFSVKIDLTVIAALMTIIGYSLNDTIVIFDRIRENRTGVKRTAILGPYINTSVNQTLSRTVLTSLTTLFVVFVMAVMGGRVLEGFSVTLLVGIVVGTYSTIFIASPILAIDWTKYQNVLYGFAGVALLLLALHIFPALRFLPLFSDWKLDILAYVTIALFVGVWLCAGYHFFATSKTEPGTNFLDASSRPPASDLEPTATANQPGEQPAETKSESTAAAKSESASDSASVSESKAETAKPAESKPSESESDEDEDEDDEAEKKPAGKSEAKDKKKDEKKDKKGGKKNKKKKRR